MTTSFDAPRYQRALERWRVLAERRLEHMTLLYETGRWRRYFTEEEFISVIRESRAAAETWQKIVPEQARIAQLFVMPDEPVFGRTPQPPSPFAAPIEQQRSVA